MNKDIKEAIGVLVKKITADDKIAANEHLHLSQSVVNLANAAHTLVSIDVATRT